MLERRAGAHGRFRLHTWACMAMAGLKIFTDTANKDVCAGAGVAGRKQPGCWDTEPDMGRLSAGSLWAGVGEGGVARKA
jgi:hypothetical protein